MISVVSRSLAFILLLFCGWYLPNNIAIAANVPLTAVEQEALSKIREGFIGYPANWLNTTIGNPCSKWTGIGCNAAGVFIRIQLTGRVCLNIENSYLIT
jgi:hypothetical protein